MLIILKATDCTNNVSNFVLFLTVPYYKLVIISHARYYTIILQPPLHDNCRLLFALSDKI